MKKASKNFKKGEEVSRCSFKAFRPRSVAKSVETVCFFYAGKYLLPNGEGQLYEESEDPNLTFETKPEKLKIGPEGKIQNLSNSIIFKATKDIKSGDYLTINRKKQ